MPSAAIHHRPRPDEPQKDEARAEGTRPWRSRLRPRSRGPCRDLGPQLRTLHGGSTGPHCHQVPRVWRIVPSARGQVQVSEGSTRLPSSGPATLLRHSPRWVGCPATPSLTQTAVSSLLRGGSLQTHHYSPGPQVTPATGSIFLGLSKPPREDVAWGQARKSSDSRRPREKVFKPPKKAGLDPAL